MYSFLTFQGVKNVVTVGRKKSAAKAAGDQPARGQEVL
jgi:hypothetical protein